MQRYYCIIIRDVIVQYSENNGYAKKNTQECKRRRRRHWTTRQIPRSTTVTKTLSFLNTYILLAGRRPNGHATTKLGNVIIVLLYVMLLYSTRRIMATPRKHPRMQEETAASLDDTPDPTESDCYKDFTLWVEDRSLFTSRSFLASASPVWRKMLFGKGFAEEHQHSIHLPHKQGIS